MKRPLMILVGCGAWMIAATLLSSNVCAETSASAEKTRAVNHRNEQYDADKNGKLDETEIAAMKADRAAKRHARMLAKYDANKNGALDPEEEAVRQTDLEKRRQLRAERKKAKEAEKAAAAAAETPPQPDDDEDEETASKP